MIPAIDKKGNTVGWLRQSGSKWIGYMTKDDALANRYPVGFGSQEDALHGISQILSEIRAEHAFERRYA